MKSFVVLATFSVLLAIAHGNHAAPQEPLGSMSTFQYCPDEVSLSKVKSLTMTNCSDSGCVVSARELSRVVIAYTAGGNYSSLDYIVSIRGAAGRYNLVQGTGVEEIQTGVDYTIGVNFVLNGTVPPGDYTLRLIRQTPVNPTTELCIELGLTILNDDVENTCNPDACREEGYCLEYKRCVKKEGDSLGRWEVLDCGTDLFWNPNSNVHGGSCDYFVNLPAQIQEQYKKDGNCIAPCEWWQADDCSATYNYRVPFDNRTLQGRELTLSCPSPPPGEEPLLWVQSTLSCNRCSDVVDRNNNPCDCGVDEASSPSPSWF